MSGERTFTYEIGWNGNVREVEYSLDWNAADPYIGEPGHHTIGSVCRFTDTGEDVPDATVEQCESELIEFAEETLTEEARAREGQKHNEVEQAARDGEWGVLDE